MPASGLVSTVRRIPSVLATILAGYAVAAVVLGLVPVNTRFVSPAGGVEIFLVTNGVHAGIALPLSETASISPGLPEPPGGTTPGNDFVVVGWGDGRVYPATGTLRDLTLANGVTAMLGLNPAVLHVEYVPRPQPSTRIRSTRVTPAGFQRLLAHVAGSFKRDAAGQPLLMSGVSHGRNDAFYLANGRYQPLYTCNEWVRRGLAAAGVRTARWSPFDIALFHQFPR